MSIPLSLYAQLQSPAEFLFPHPYEHAFTPHHLLVEYFRHVAAHSPMVHLKEIGNTYEHRPMIIAFVSTSQNIQNLEQIRVNHLRLAGLGSGSGDAETAKAIVWLGYSVHGNEASGSEASMQVLYDLVMNTQNAHTWLENTIVILEPSCNPDGYNRYSNWNNQVSMIPFNASADAREHHEPWPGGRVNHYLFDLNRDWAWQSQKESQQRIAEYLRWMPHVVADLHEMGYTNPYYFAPAAQPYHEFVTPWQTEFQVVIGKNHAKYFDQQGWSYFTKERFDLFYPSYGDTYPVFNGAIGMTYEQGGHSFAGRAITLPNADTLKLSDRIAHHVTTSLSTIEVTSSNARRVVREFTEYFDESGRNPPGTYKTYVIKDNEGNEKIRSLCTLLDRQGIRYGRMETPLRNKTGYHYLSGRDQLLTIEPEDLVVSAYQPRAVLTQILFDPESKLVDSITYDITCWSLPYAYGVNAYALKEKVDIKAGYDFADPVPPASDETYAYALRWESLQDGKLLAAALKEGMHPRFTTSTFRLDGKEFKPGTILFMRTDHRLVGGYPQRLIALSDSFDLQLVPIRTGFVETGNDFGSSAYHFIPQPHVITLSGEGVFANEAGQVWHLFEQTLKYPLTVVDVDELSFIAWNEYDILIMPAGYYTIEEDVMKHIQSWVTSGGKIIAIGSALSHFRDKEGYALKRFAESERSEEVKKAEEEERLRLRLETHESSYRRDISSEIAGAVFKARVDSTHPLGFGLGEYYFSLKTDASSYEHLVDADNVIYLDSNLIHYGFAGAKALEKQKNSVLFAVEQKGNGTLVYMVDNPLFRSFWENGKFLFCNALFFVGN